MSTRKMGENMKLKAELLSKELANCIINNLENIDADKIADAAAICALSEIKDIIKKSLS